LVQILCEQHIQSRMNIKNVVQFFCASDRTNCLNLKDLCLQFILSNYALIVQTNPESLKNMDKELLVEGEVVFPFLLYF